MKYSELNVNDKILKAVEDMGFEEMTKIQEAAIMPAVMGEDILGQAQTGTGKTASFVIPVLEKLDFNSRDVQAIMLAPTRELAIQIKNEIGKIGKYMNINVVAVFGGDPIDKQIKLLRDKPQIVVGTPGRTLDLLKRKKLKLHEIKFFVLDEVDEMLNMGFIDDVEEIISQMPSQKQTLLFSATMPERIKRIANKYLTNPKHIKVNAKSLTVDKVEQGYMIVKHKQKLEVLEDILLLRQGEKVIVFAQTKKMCDEVYDYLKERQIRVGKIHGDIVQKTRTMTIEQFKKDRFDVLIATDVVARGIDIDGITLVVNLELPQDREYYIHRIGRTARGNSKKGEAITLVTPSAYSKEFKHYPKYLNCDIKELKRPTQKDIVGRLMWKYTEAIQTEIAKNDKLDESYYSLSATLLAEHNENLLIPILLKQLYPELGEKKKPREEVTLSESSNGRGRGGNGGGYKNGRRGDDKNFKRGRRPDRNKTKRRKVLDK